MKKRRGDRQARSKQLAHKTKPSNGGPAYGDITDKIFRLIADNPPLTRRALLDEFAKRWGEDNRLAASRRIGRLVEDIGLLDQVTLNGKDHRVGLPSRGIVSVNLDVERLNRLNRRDASPPEERTNAAVIEYLMAPRNSASLFFIQERVIDAIVQGTVIWLKHESGNEIWHPTLVLTDAAIVHGGPFDLFLDVLFTDSDTFTRWVREVLQATRFVRQTQTMTVPYDLTHPNYRGEWKSRQRRAQTTAGIPADASSG